MRSGSSHNFLGGSHLILAVSPACCEGILDVPFHFTRDGVATALSIATSRSRTPRGCVAHRALIALSAIPLAVAPHAGAWLTGGRTPRGGGDSNKHLGQYNPGRCPLHSMRGAGIAIVSIHKNVADLVMSHSSWSAWIITLFVPNAISA